MTSTTSGARLTATEVAKRLNVSSRLIRHYAKDCPGARQTGSHRRWTFPESALQWFRDQCARSDGNPKESEYVPWPPEVKAMLTKHLADSRGQTVEEFEAQSAQHNLELAFIRFLRDGLRLQDRLTERATEAIMDQQPRTEEALRLVVRSEVLGLLGELAWSLEVKFHESGARQRQRQRQRGA